MIVRRTLGVATPATVLLLATGTDHSVFGTFAFATAGSAEEALVRRLVPGR